jgi:hypothetical protein
LFQSISNNKAGPALEKPGRSASAPLIARRKDDEVLREKIFQELFSRQLVMGFDVGRIAARVPNFKGL